jgi:hypothetical protein
LVDLVGHGASGPMLGKTFDHDTCGSAGQVRGHRFRRPEDHR